MKKSIKRSFAVVCLLLVLALLFHLTNKPKLSASNEEIPVSTVMGSYIIDVTNQRELVGSADYVFVGEVLKNEGVDYRNPVIVEDAPNEPYTITSPYTNYTVQILENIKGNLITDQSIPIAKDGGLSEDGSCYVLYEKDELPIEKEIYMFYAFAQQDGSLLLSGRNSNIKINGQKDSFQNTDIYQEVLEASRNPAFVDRKRSASVYEAGTL